MDDMQKCEECGCYQVASYNMEYFRQELHFKGCPKIELWNRKVLKKDSLKRRVEEVVGDFENSIAHLKEKIIGVRDIIKDPCLDEVYECRWDCMAVLGGA